MDSGKESVMNTRTISTEEIPFGISSVLFTEEVREGGFEGDRAER